MADAAAPDGLGPGSAVDRYGRFIGLVHASGDDAQGVVLRVEIRPEHLNGAGIAHGGVLFSALDEAVAIVANRRAPGSVLTTGSLHCLRAVPSGTLLAATVTPVREGRRLSLYHGNLVRPDGELVAQLIAEYISLAPTP